MASTPGQPGGQFSDIFSIPKALAEFVPTLKGVRRRHAGEKAVASGITFPRLS
jgi:hypothetical protein